MSLTTAERLRGNGATQGLTILGSTGSIGTQTLEIVRLFPDRFRVVALTALRNVDLLAEQALEFRPIYVVVGEEAEDDMRSRVEEIGIRVLTGREALCSVASLEEVDTVVAALVGFAGLESVLAAVQSGKNIALANKETLVVAGELVRERLAAHGATVIPVDSEHSAIFQCLAGERVGQVEEIILTASGGPFRTRPLSTFPDITRDEALAHPNWSMGQKITIDSATMMNKGLEVIEARWLFDETNISVLVHPQSIVHSMVNFVDGSTKAQLGIPDMKVPIQYALSYPERWPAPHDRIDWSQLRCLDFEQPDLEKFPCLSLAYEALRIGGSAPAVLNAANEEAVSLFLEEDIRFVDIPNLIEAALARLSNQVSSGLEELVAADAEARAYVLELAAAGTI